MQLKLHTDVLLHLMREHPDVIFRIVDTWPKDEEGNRKYCPKGELPQEFVDCIVGAIFAEEDPNQRPAPYKDKTIYSKRPTYLPASLVPAMTKKRDLKKPPQKYVTADPANAEYHANLPPLNVPGETGDQSLFGDEALPSLWPGREADNLKDLDALVEDMLDDEQKHARDFGNAPLEDTLADPDLQTKKKRSKKDMALFGETVAGAGEEDAHE